jgi:hypothetical protein
MRVMGALLLLAVGCSSSKIEVRSGHDPDFDFSGLKTYGWLAPTKSGNERINDERLEKNVRAAVARELEAKGFRFAETEPDFFVGYHAILRRQRSVQSVDQVYGYGSDTIWTGDYTPRMDPATHPEVYEHVYHVGTLILDIAAGRRKDLVWRASARAIVEPKAPAERGRRVTSEAVRKMLAKFPPAAGKAGLGAR